MNGTYSWFSYDRDHLQEQEQPRYDEQAEWEKIDRAYDEWKDNRAMRIDL